MFNQNVLKERFKCTTTETGLDIRFDGDLYKYDEDKDVITFTEEDNVYTLFDNGEVDSLLKGHGSNLQLIWELYKNGLCLFELKSKYPLGIKDESLVHNDPDGFCYYVASNILAHINRKWLGVIWINDNDENFEFMVNSSNDFTKINNDKDRAIVEKLMKEIEPYF